MTTSDEGTPTDEHRVPEQTSDEAAPGNNGAGSDRTPESPELLGSFPPEIASLLIVAGVAGILLPGPIGTPLLIAGGVVLWPKTFRPIERWFSRRFPRAHHEGVVQLKEFIDDLNRRFPE